MTKKNSQNNDDFILGCITSDEKDPFSRQKLIPGWDQDKLKNTRIMVVGAGAIGNEVLKNLALLGFGHIYIVDMDKISITNLSRTVLFRMPDNGKPKASVAALRVKELCLQPDAKVDSFNGDLVHGLGDGIYRHFDIIIGCLDNLEARIAVSRGCWLFDVPWVDGGIAGFDGNVTVFYPPETSCYLCTLGKEDFLQIQSRYSCDNRKRQAIAESKIPTVQISSAIIGAFQVQEVIRLIHSDHSKIGKIILYNGNEGILNTRILPKTDDHDFHHGSYINEDIIELNSISSDVTIREFFETTRSITGLELVSLKLPTRPGCSFVTFAKCKKCGAETRIMKPLFRITADEYNKCNRCGVVQHNTESANNMIINFIEQNTISFNRDEDLLDLKLTEVGFAPLDIIMASDKNTSKYFELTLDLPRLLPSW